MHEAYGCLTVIGRNHRFTSLVAHCIERDAEKFQAGADARANDWRILPNPSSEDYCVHTTQCHSQRTDPFSGLITK